MGQLVVIEQKRVGRAKGLLTLGLGKAETLRKLMFVRTETCE